MSGAALKPILAIDFGRVRIGLAISDELQLLAHPLETIPASKEAVARIAAIVRERKIDKVIVGIPRRMSGEIGAAATEALRFVERLRAVLPCEVIPWDERLSTVAANRALQEAGKKTRATRPYIDQVAAQLILQAYLDHQSSTPAQPVSR
jgi:putative Holliday junction resolvase